MKKKSLITKIPKELAEKQERSRNKLTNRNWKFTEDEKMKIITMISSGMTVKEIQEEAKECYNITISKSQIVQYKTAPKWQDTIKQLRQSFLVDPAQVAGAHKRVRLERAERAYDRAYAKGNVKETLMAIEHQRKEMEERGEPTTFSLAFHQYNIMSDEELERRKFEALEFLKQHEEKSNVESSKE